LGIFQNVTPLNTLREFDGLGSDGGEGGSGGGDGGDDAPQQ